MDMFADDLQGLLKALGLRSACVLGYSRAVALPWNFA
jgi:hypothetical protein